MAEGKNLDLEAAVQAFREVRPGADTIVICDDTEFLLKMIARTVRTLTADLGVTVETFPGANEALDLVNKHKERILLVFSDRDMGGRSMVGEAFAEALRVDFVDDTTPFLMATGGDIEGNPSIQSALKNGYMDGVLQKPFVGALATAIAAAITARIDKVEAEALMATLEEA